MTTQTDKTWKSLDANQSGFQLSNVKSKAKLSLANQNRQSSEPIKI